MLYLHLNSSVRRNVSHVQCGVSRAPAVQCEMGISGAAGGQLCPEMWLLSLSCWQNPPQLPCAPGRAGLAWFCSGCALPCMATSATTLSWARPGLSPGWLCSSAGSHPDTAPVLQPCLRSDVGTAKPSSNHSENQLNSVTKKITLV